MKIVMFADLHLERQFAWADSSAASRRRRGLRTTLANIVELAVTESADAILCGGDLYEDQYFSPDLANFVASTIDCGIPMLFSPGNHDYVSPSSLYSRAALPSTAHVFAGTELAPFELTPGLRVWGGAHVAPAGTLGFLDRCLEHQAKVMARQRDSGVNLALFHGSERSGFAFEGGDKQPHAPFARAQVGEAGFDYAFVGHHHRAVQSEVHCYPGNPDPLEFGEDAGRGAVIAEIAADGTVRVESAAVAATISHSVVVDVTGCENGTDVLRLVTDRVAPLTGFVRADLVGELDPDVEIDPHQLKELGRDLDGFVARVNKIQRSYQLDEIAAEEASVRAHFVRLVQQNQEMTDQDKQLVIELGLRSFDNRRDLEVV